MMKRKVLRFLWLAVLAGFGTVTTASAFASNPVAGLGVGAVFVLWIALLWAEDPHD